jgi:NADH-quinone oxidoreductase subunit H
LKLLFKEDICPTRAHRVLYSLAPFIVMTVALTTFAVVPFGDFLEIGGRRIPLIVADLNVGILYVLAIASLGTYGIVLGGWSSDSKYSFLGAVRSSAQMISYEISMGLAIMGMLLIFSSFRLSDIVAGQGELIWGFLPRWGVVVQPLGCILFLTAIFAETNRNPFDLPEGESEIVAGFHLEYSSMKFALFFMAEYCNMVVAAALVTTLFFGGYQIPWLPRTTLAGHAGVLLPLGLALTAIVCGGIAALFFRRAGREKNRFGDGRDREPGLLGGVFALLAGAALIGFGLKPWAVGPHGASVFATVAQIGAFLMKVVFFSWLFIWVRWTLPRFRYDQLMRLGWKVMLPLGLLNLVITALVVAAL